MTETADVTFGADVAFTKIDEDQRIVYGWASIIKRDGEIVGDHQGDVITAVELEKAAHHYVQTARVGKQMHAGDKTADMVESFVVSPQSFGVLCKAMGMTPPDPLPFEGWWVGFKVHDEAVWKRVKSGELRSFSIGGTGKRIPLPPA